MKTFTLGFVLVVLCTCHQLSQAMTEEEGVALAKQMMEECIKDTAVSADEAKKIMDDKNEGIDVQQNFSANMKCFLLCFYKKLGLVDAAGKPNNEKLLQFMTSRFEDKKDKVQPAMAKCASITDANPCEMVYKFEVCMAQNIGR